MKKIIYILILLVTSIGFSQIYPSYTKVIYASHIYQNGSPTLQVGTLIVNNNNLTVNIGVSWSVPQYLSVNIPLNINPSLPNMPNLYTFGGNSSSTGYRVAIYSNSLVIYSTGQPVNVSSCNVTYSGCIITTWYNDSDSDTFGNAANSVSSCVQPVGYVANNTDCNDTNANINPNTVWYADNDIDGYGSNIVISTQCIQPPLSCSNNLDCNDNNNQINITSTWYDDSDDDGYGDPNVTLATCDTPTSGNWVQNNNDQCPTISGSIMGCVVPVASSGNSSSNFGNDLNYIITSVPKIPVSDLQSITDAKDVSTNITYYDGLGRPMQTIASKQSSLDKDIVTPIEYDGFGRQEKDYLPYASTQNNLAFIDTPTAVANIISQYQTTYGDTNPYSQKEFEASPLNRIFKQAAPGNDWALGAGHEIKFDYQTNVANEVKLYSVTATWNTTYKIYGNIPLTDGGFYSANQLYKTITKDENWVSGNGNTTIEYKDKEGRLVLKRNNVEKTNKFGAITVTPHDTYYVYDQFGNLTYVIPPLVDTSIVLTTTVLNNLCYQYKYDHRNRLAEKKLPGKQWEFIVYDKLDRVVATGPALSPFTDIVTSGWLITKYDAYNRVAYTGWENLAATATSRTTKQTTQNGITTSALFESKAAPGVIDAIGAYYTNTVAPTSIKLLTANFYDDYNYSYTPVFPVSPVLGQAVYYDKTTTKPKGLQTGSWTRTLSTSSSAVGEYSYILYDYKSRPIRTYTRNFLGGYTQVDTQYDFVGKVITTQTTHNRTLTTPATITINDNFTYTNQDQLAKHTQSINGVSPERLIAENTYDELGKLISKKVGNQVTATTPLQKIDYNYNIRGWLKGINDDANGDLLLNTSENDLFSFKINYNTVQNVSGYTGKALFNGNISETHWRSLSDNVLRKYGYYYDPLNRLTNAVYQKPDNTVPVPNSYNEYMDYDKNGNISYMNRYGDGDGVLPAVLIDQLSYTYEATSNKLIKVEDGTPSTSGFNNFANTAVEYAYDANGNMTRDDNKRITTITYNHLNLPTKITFGTLGNIAYTYSATGQKLKKVVTVTTPASVTTTDYTTGFQYENTVLQFFPHAEGYVKNTAGVYSYVFNYTDHLGNTRLSYSDLNNDNTIATSEILEESHYYPFGLKHSGYNMNNAQPKYKYKFQGQEQQDELGLNWDSFKYRNYDYAIGRFMCIDPLTEKYMDWAPYVFSGNRVIDSRELEGLEPVEINKGTKNLVIVVEGWDGGNPDAGKTQVTPDKNSFSSALVSAYSSQEGTQVAVFGSSMISRTPDDISKSIENFRAESPEGKLVLAGHSLGADNLVNVVNDNPDVKVDKLITLDISDPLGVADNQIPSNVAEAKNYMQTSSTAGGTLIEAAEGNTTTKITNVKAVEGTTHKTIDNVYRGNVVNEVKNVIPIQ